MTKALFFLTIFLLFSVSYADRFDVVNNLFKSSSSSSSSQSDDADPKIRLPTEPRPTSDLTQSQPLGSDRVVTVDFDLTDLINRRPVHLPNRMGFPFIHYFPRRCRHHNHHLLSRFPGRSIDLGPLVPIDEMATLFKKNAEVVRHRHVAGDGGERLVQLHGVYFGHPDLRNGGVYADRTVEVRREDESDNRDKMMPLHDHHHHGDHHHEEVEMKTEYEGELHRHHHHHDHHEEHEEKHEKKESDIVNKIRKFLLNF